MRLRLAPKLRIGNKNNIEIGERKGVGNGNKTRTCAKAKKREKKHKTYIEIGKCGRRSRTSAMIRKKSRSNQLEILGVHIANWGVLVT